MCDTATCKKCGASKSKSEFYKHPKASTGYDSTCKDCRKEMVRSNRLKKEAYYREYDKTRYQNDPRVRERHRRYAKTDAGKMAFKKAHHRWAVRNAKKVWCSCAVNNAVRDGKIKKPSECSSCGSTPNRIEGHHPDYDKPLEVIWLCSQCHADWHNEHGEGLNPGFL